MPDFALGRVLPPPDPRDLPMSAHPLFAEMEVSRPTSKMWRAGLTKLDQMQTPHCVGFTGANWMQNSPVRMPVANETGHKLYEACKAIDGYPGDGTYGRALLKVLQGRNLVGRYRWAATTDEILTWLGTMGPVMLGIPWYESMFDPDLSGRLRIGGSMVGGHEVLVRGYPYPNRVRITNSWGSNWGVNGDAVLYVSDLARLLAEGGDAWGVEQIS